ncbi:MAG: OsmC family protein [Firmicutes bacterium]|nr:OsmC family protein [Bacillota bacterium]
MKARVRWNGKMGFVGISGTNHTVPMDVSPAVGGDGAAASPLEMVLMGLAGCSGADVVSILRKKKIKIDDFQIFLEAERAADHPKVFTKVDLRFVFRGDNLRLKPLEDSVRLSVEKYCSVAGMIEKTAQIEWKVEIED